MVKKSRNASPAHPAMLGLQHFLRSVPEEKRSQATRELKRTSGMNALHMYSHIGSRVAQGANPKPPSQDEIEAQNRLAKLHV